MHKKSFSETIFTDFHTKIKVYLVLHAISDVSKQKQTILL